MTDTKKYKLSGQEQYGAVFANRKLIKNKYFKLFLLKNQLGYPRIGISVAKRNVSKAVTRNKLKRIIKESFRLNCNQLQSVDMVLIINKEAGLEESKCLFNELNKRWPKIATVTNTP